MAEEHKEFVTRFYELLKATKHQKITEYDKDGVILFDEQAVDVRALFAVDTVFNQLLNTNAVIFELGARTISLFLWPEKGNPITIFIHPIPGVANGESVNAFISEEKIDVAALKAWLHKYFTNREFKVGIISDKDNYTFVPKD